MRWIPKNQNIALTMALFVLQPIAIGGWFALIPYVQDKLALSKSELAIALLGMSWALVLTLQIAGRVIDRFGPRHVFIWMFPTQAVVVLLPLFSTDQFRLFLALLALGVAVAFLQVSLNVYAGRLEKSLGALIMNRCHGFWSLGLGAGSMLVTLLASVVSPVLALGCIVFLAALAGVFVARNLPKIKNSQVAHEIPRRKLSEIPSFVFVLAAMLIWVTMTEGAMADWAAIYMAEILPPGSSTVGYAVTLYAGFVTIGRFLGDTLNKRFGPVILARVTLVTCLVGLFILVLPVGMVGAYAGFALVGLGVSVMFPLGVSAIAGKSQGHETGNIALVSSFAITGFLLGPPLIGFLAEAFGLRVGFAALMPGLCISFLLAGQLRPKPRDSTLDSFQNQGAG